MTTKETINGLDIAKFQDAVNLVAQRKGTRHAPKKARIRWQGGFKFNALVRNHTFLVDEPAQLTGKDEAPNSMEYVLGALGACLATGFVLLASKKGIVVRNMEVTLDSTQDNVLTFLGLGGDGHSGFDGIIAKLYVQADGPADTLKEIWDETIQISPVGNSLAVAVPITSEIDVLA